MLWRALNQEHFIRYRAQLEYADGPPLLVGRKLSLYEWTYFEPEELEVKNFFKRLLVRSRIDDKSILVEGTRDGETWVPVTWWALNKWRNTEIRVRAEESARRRIEGAKGEDLGSSASPGDEEVAAEMRRIRKHFRPKPKMGEAACHVARCLKLGEGRVFDILVAAGYEDVVEENMPDLIENGRRRIERDHKECVLQVLARTPPVVIYGGITGFLPLVLPFVGNAMERILFSKGAFHWHFGGVKRVSEQE